MENSKTCTTCNKTKSLTEFHKQHTGKFGRNAKCKVCRNSEAKEYYKDNRSNIITKNTAYNKEHKDKHIEAVRRYQDKNREEIKEYTNQYLKDKRDNNPQFKIRNKVRAKINVALRRYLSTGKDKYYPELGMGLHNYVKFIEERMTEDMNWDNWGTTWHIDHVQPFEVFNLETEQGINSAFHHSNTYPLLRELNNLKSNKVLTKDEYQKLIERQENQVKNG